MSFPEAPDGLAKKRTERSDDFALLKDAVREAGKIALGYFGRSPEVEIKPDNSPVSEADIAVDSALKNMLAGTRPAYAWLSEESIDDPRRLHCEHVWVVDPIDGTSAFLREVPEWIIAAALVEQGRPVLSVVYNPVRREFFEAEAGGGARLNGEQVFVRDPVSLDHCDLITSRSLLRRKIWSEPWPRLRTRWVNSIAYRLALVSMGRHDATLSLTGKSDWDLAAAELLVQEAGGCVTTHLGEGFRYNQSVPRQKSVVAAGPALHAELLRRTRTAAI